MRAYEIIESEQLDEISLKQIALAAMLGTASLGSSTALPKDYTPTQVEQQQILDMRALANDIASKYRVDKALATEIVMLAHKHADPVFPTAHDLLAIVGVESSFNPTAVSNLKRDPAVGLTQIRPGVWGLDAQALLASKDEQLRQAAKIFRKYYKKLGDKASAVQAYNVGITSFRRGDRNPRYLSKFNNELSRYKSIT